MDCKFIKYDDTFSKTLIVNSYAEDWTSDNLETIREFVVNAIKRVFQFCKHDHNKYTYVSNIHTFMRGGSDFDDIYYVTSYDEGFANKRTDIIRGEFRTRSNGLSEYTISTDIGKIEIIRFTASGGCVILKFRDIQEPLRVMTSDENWVNEYLITSLKKLIIYRCTRSEHESVETLSSDGVRNDLIYTIKLDAKEFYAALDDYKGYLVQEEDSFFDYTKINAVFKEITSDNPYEGFERLGELSVYIGQTYFVILVLKGRYRKTMMFTGKLDGVRIQGDKTKKKYIFTVRNTRDIPGHINIEKRVLVGIDEHEIFLKKYDPDNAPEFFKENEIEKL